MLRAESFKFTTVVWDKRQFILSDLGTTVNKENRKERKGTKVSIKWVKKAKSKNERAKVYTYTSHHVQTKSRRKRNRQHVLVRNCEVRIVRHNTSKHYKQRPTPSRIKAETLQTRKKKDVTSFSPLVAR